MLRVSKLVVMAAILCAAQFAYGQGGPPMITDDPGTPGNGKWEINLATAFEHRSGETSLDIPAVDLNYGVGEHIQLTLQTAPALLFRSDHGPVGGIGGTEAALKWRSFDEEKSGFDVSIFPRVLFNVAQSSVRRGLAEDGTRFQLPIQIARRCGPLQADFEFGSLISTVGRSEWLYGMVGGVDLSKKTRVMAELHGTSRSNFSRDVLTVNLGLRQEITPACILIASLGHQVRSAEQDHLALIGYLGVQLLY